MVVHVATNIDDHLVKNDEFLTKFYRIVKVLLIDASFLLYLPLNFAGKNRTMSALSDDQCQGKASAVYYNEEVSAIY